MKEAAPGQANKQNNKTALVGWLNPTIVRSEVRGIAEPCQVACIPVINGAGAVFRTQNDHVAVSCRRASTDRSE